jgi:hypothetical protein
MKTTQDMKKSLTKVDEFRKESDINPGHKNSLNQIKNTIVSYSSGLDSRIKNFRDQRQNRY